MNGPPDKDRRPSVGQTEKAAGAYLGGDASPVYSGPSVHAVIRLDVRRANTGDPHRLDRLVQSAAEAPAGATVIIEVGRGQHPPGMAIHWLRDNATHLGRLVIEAEDTATASRWVQALRDRGGCR